MKYNLTYVENLVNELLDIQTSVIKMKNIKNELIDIAKKAKELTFQDELHAWAECVDIHISLSEKRLGYPSYPCDIANILYLIRN